MEKDTLPKKNIFLTGPPSSGKTTVIRKVIAMLPERAKGFTTEEERSGGRRAGFIMRSLDGKTGYLAHRDIRSSFTVHRYGVSMENIDAIAVPSIEPSGDDIIILDEIGRMECFSRPFRSAAIAALDSGNIVLGTITLSSDEFLDGIKKRDDIEITEVTRENRELLPAIIVKKIARLRGREE